MQQPINPATTTTTAFIGASSSEPFYEAQQITTSPKGDTPLDRAVAQFFLGGASSAWIVSTPSDNADLAQALAALDAVPSLNLVAMPDLATLASDAHHRAAAQIAEYCARRRAFFILDPPSDWTDVDSVANGVSDIAAIVKENGAIYWPLLTTGTPTIPVSGAVAAVYVATDQSRGVWKAPAGIGAVLADVEPALELSDNDTGLIGPLGVNVIRIFPVYGTVVWGARTLAGADQLQSDWKYVPVRRLTLYIESSITDSLHWTAFLPNTPALWENITFSVTAFLTKLFNEGAFAGASAKDAFFVQCDATTTTPDDIAQGVVNIVVGFAPVLPAEFVILQIQTVAASAG